MRRNQIIIIPEGIFKNLVRIKELGIEQNHEMPSTKEFFKDLVSLEYFILDDFFDTRVDLNYYDDSFVQDSTGEQDSTGIQKQMQKKILKKEIVKMLERHWMCTMKNLTQKN